MYWICAACIDVCDQVMDKVKLPRGLIRYSENALAKHSTQRDYRPIIPPSHPALHRHSDRHLWFSGLVPNSPDTAQVDIIRDRSTLAREADDGRIENVFTLQIHEPEEVPHRCTITVGRPKWGRNRWPKSG